MKEAPPPVVIIPGKLQLTRRFCDQANNVVPTFHRKPPMHIDRGSIAGCRNGGLRVAGKKGALSAQHSRRRVSVGALELKNADEVADVREHLLAVGKAVKDAARGAKDWRSRRRRSWPRQRYGANRRRSWPRPGPRRRPTGIYSRLGALSRCVTFISSPIALSFTPVSSPELSVPRQSRTDQSPRRVLLNNHGHARIDKI